MTDLQARLDTTLTRRRLVLAGGSAAIGMYLMGGVAAAAATAPAHLRRASYSRRVGASFAAIRATGTVVTLRLAEVADLARARQMPSLAGRDDAFALVFTGPATAAAGRRHPQAAPSVARLDLAVHHAGRRGRNGAALRGDRRPRRDAVGRARQSIGRPRNRSRPALPFERDEKPWRA